MTTLPRGIRNNNPGNIRISKDAWRGLDDHPKDTAFFTFVSPSFGIRALILVLRTYRLKYSIDTVRGIIHRWAPAIENDTTSYIEAVSQDIGVLPDDVIDVLQRPVMEKLVKAIIAHENGVQPYGDEVFNTAFEMVK